MIKNIEAKLHSRKWVLMISIILFLIQFIPRMVIISKAEAISGGDAYNNLLITKSIANLQNPFGDRRLPFYPLLLLPGHLINNVDPLWWGRTVSAFFGSLSVVFIFLLGNRIGFSYLISIPATIMAGYSSSYFFYSIRPLSNALYGSLVVLAVYFFFNLKSTRYLILFSTILGLMSMTRHEGFIVSIVFFGFYLFNCLIERRHDINKYFILALPYLIIVLPFFINNYFKFGSLTYSSYLSNSEGLYIPHTIQDFYTNLSKLFVNYISIWSNSNWYMQSSTVLFTICGIIFLKKYIKISNLFLYISILLSQLTILLFLQPSSRYFSGITPLVAILYTAGSYDMLMEMFRYIEKIKIFKYVYVILMTILCLFFIKNGYQSNINRINEINMGAHSEYLLRQAIIFANKLSGKIGVEVPFPQAQYFFSDNVVFLSSSGKDKLTIEEQMEWINDNNIKYILWSSDHNLFTLVSSGNNIRLLREFTSDNYSVAVYEII